MKRKTLYYIAILALGFIFVIAFYRSGFPKGDLQKIPEKTGTNFLMNTLIQIKVYGEDGERVIDRCFERLRNIEDMMSKTRENSDIYKLNENNFQGEFIPVNSDTFKVIERSLYYAQLTEGKFDPSIGPLVELWGIGTKDARVPSEKEIKEAQSRVDYRQIILNHQNNSVKLLTEGMKLDLGAIVKGYAADEFRDIIRAEGINSAYINLGGNVLVIGGKPDGTPWKIGIQDPRINHGGAVASIEIKDKTIVTSGNYERYFTEEGVIYHHIIDPTTGYPAKSGIISISIICDYSIDADALSTSVFVMGVEKGLELINHLEGIEAIIIRDDLGIVMTDGLKDKLVLLNKDFYFSGK